MGARPGAGRPTLFNFARPGLRSTVKLNNEGRLGQSSYNDD